MSVPYDSHPSNPEPKEVEAGDGYFAIFFYVICAAMLAGLVLSC